MARPLPDLPTRALHLIPAPVTFFVVLAAVFSVFSVVTFMCGSHAKEKRTVILRGKKESMIKKMQSSLSSKALLMAKMISWRKVQDEGGDRAREGFDDGGVDIVWKKTIIKGEKCRPLEFSGKILYDSYGNLLPG